MKNSLISKLPSEESSQLTASGTKVPRGPMVGPMAFAHYLGFDTPKAKAATTKVQSQSALRKPAATPEPSAKRATATAKSVASKAATGGRSTTAPKSGATRERCAMPFTSEMGGFKATAREERAADTLRVPVVANGTATGEFIEVQRPKVEAPKLDASAIARRVVAAGKRIFTK